MWQALIAGAAGGIIPTTAKMASTYVTVPATPLPEIGLLLGLALFAVIGAAIAYGTAQTDIRQALIAGIAAPGIITNLVAGTDTQKHASLGEHDSRIAGIISIIPAARAQDRSPATGLTATSGMKSITIDPRVQGGIPAQTKIPITAEISGGPNNEMHRVQIGTITSLTDSTKLTVPLNTTHVRIGDTQVSVPSNDNKIDLSVSTKSTIQSDFLWALGGQRSYAVDHIVPKVDTRGPQP
jgi:hypothetical protein